MGGDQIGVNAHQAIIPALKDERWYLVRNLLIVLGQQPDLSSIKAIQQLANHPHPRVRQEVIRILLKLNPATANRLLRKELSSIEQDSLLAAAEVAQASQDPAVVQRLHQLLQEEDNSPPRLELKRQILASLAVIGRPESLPVLKGLLKKRGLLTSRNQKQLHHAIINSLGHYPREIAEPLLKELVRGRLRHQAKLATEQLQQFSGGTA